MLSWKLVAWPVRSVTAQLGQASNRLIESLLPVMNMAYYLQGADLCVLLDWLTIAPLRLGSQCHTETNVHKRESKGGCMRK
jgi:hypothetical protein